jgi:hypothetical protein
MARRREPPDALDFFCTPPWATRALFRHVLPAIGVEAAVSVWEPACGEGHMAALIEEFARGPVVASDIFGGYGYGLAPIDFLNEIARRRCGAADTQTRLGSLAGWRGHAATSGTNITPLPLLVG